MNWNSREKMLVSRLKKRNTEMREKEGDREEEKERWNKNGQETIKNGSKDVMQKNRG